MKAFATRARALLGAVLLLAGLPASAQLDIGRMFELGKKAVEVGAKVQGSFTCHKLKAPDGKLTIEASGNYRT